MAKNNIRRKNGMGNVYQRKDGVWIGRIKEGFKSDGKPKIKYLSGKTESEVKRKIHEYIKSGPTIDKTTVSVKTYVKNWLTTYKRDKLKGSSYDRLESTIDHQIIPNLGDIQP